MKKTSDHKIKRDGSGTNIEYYNKLSMELLSDGVKQIKNNYDEAANSANALGCKVTTYASSKGRPQVRIKGIKYYATIVVRLHHERKEDPNYELHAGHDASHFICHNDACVNPEHICFEDHNVNKSRLCCRIYGTTLPGYQCPHPVPFKCHMVPETALKITQ